MQPSRVWRLFGAIAGVLFTLTAVVGFAHTKAGRPLLGWMVRAMGGHGGRCPLGYDRAATPEQKEAARARFAVMHRGNTAPGARPALGFLLDRTTRSDVLRWASTHGVACAPTGGMADLMCASVPDGLVPARFRAVGDQALWFTFGAGDRLVEVVAIAHAEQPEPVSVAFQSIVTDLDQEAGTPAHVDGDPSAERLASGALYQASAEYRFDDYYAVARATNVGRGHYVLTTEYRSLPN